MGVLWRNDAHENAVLKGRFRKRNQGADLPPAEPTAFCFTEWNVQVRTFLMMSSTVSRRRVSVWMLLLMTLRE